MRILHRFNVKVLSSLCGLSLLAFIFFLTQRPAPTSRQGLIPLSLLLNNQINTCTSGQFTVEYNEPHYVGLDFQNAKPGSVADSLRRQTAERIGSKQSRPPDIGISWTICDGVQTIAYGSGSGQYRGMVGNTITLGQFVPTAGHTYRIEVKTDSGFSKYLQSDPMLQVGVSDASVSVGLAFADGLFGRIWGVAEVVFLTSTLIFLILTYTSYRTQKASGGITVQRKTTSANTPNHDAP